MYQSTHSLQLNSEYLQHEALHDAEARRLARQARAASHEVRGFDFSPFQRRLVALAVALVSLLGVVVVLI
jgi:hypothetical protein